jgi:hypothetical protein
MEQHQSRSEPTETAAANTEADGPPSSSSPLHSVVNSQSFQIDPIAIGLSAKELAQLRAATSPAQPTITPPVLDESRLQSAFSPPVATTASEQRLMTSSPSLPPVQSQLDRMWREIQQLRAERLGSEAPPSYDSEEGNVR